jgi:hypothetical protein
MGISALESEVGLAENCIRSGDLFLVGLASVSSHRSKK